MATASQARSESKLSLEIRTKSIEQTLVPLVTQVGRQVVVHMHATKQLPVAAGAIAACATGFYRALQPRFSRRWGPLGLRRAALSLRPTADS